MDRPKKYATSERKGMDWANCTSFYRENPESITVITEEKTPEWCGLYDSNGVKIFKVPTRNPVGFVVE